jgi:phosphonate transport system substrate-binding protein
VVGAASGLSIPAGAGTEAVKQNLVMALVPSRQSDVIQTQADKIANFLSTETGYTIKASVVANYAAVGEGMGAKNIDIGWVGPLDYVISAKKFGVYPITASVRKNTLGYKAFVVARTDSGIKTLADLKGKTVCLGDAISASSNLYPSGALAAAGLKAGSDYTVRNISNQSAIAIAVVEKSCDAGAFYDDARTNKEVTDKYPNVLKDTQIIYTTELIPADPQIVRKDLNADQVKKIYDAMIKLSNDPNGKKYINDLFTIDGLAPVTDASYEGLRKVIQTVKPDLLNV